MNKFFGAIAAATLLVGATVPALAQMDVAAMTCGAYFDMDAAGDSVPTLGVGAPTSGEVRA